MDGSTPAKILGIPSMALFDVRVGREAWSLQRSNENHSLTIDRSLLFSSADHSDTAIHPSRAWLINEGLLDLSCGSEHSETCALPCPSHPQRASFSQASLRAGSPEACSRHQRCSTAMPAPVGVGGLTEITACQGCAAGLSQVLAHQPHGRSHAAFHGSV